MTKIDVGAAARRLMSEAAAKGETLDYTAAFQQAHEATRKERVLEALSGTGEGRTVARVRPFDVSASLERERIRLERAGHTLNEAVTEARDVTIAAITKWEADTLGLAEAKGMTIVPKVAPTPKAKPVPRAPERFIPTSMSAVEAATAAAAGRLPFRSDHARQSREHAQLMGRVAERQAKGEGYDEAFIRASAEIAAEARAAKSSGGAK